MITKVKVYDLQESIEASKYPMAVDVNAVTGEVTKTVKSLASSKQGEGHDCFLKGIRVSFDLTFSNKAWVELERYRFIDFVSSQSTMHRITKFDLDKAYNEYVDPVIIERMKYLVDRYNETKNPVDYLRVLYSNPAGFQLTARLSTNYLQLKTVYYQRRYHRLPEWRRFCEWIETLPMFKELVLNGQGATSAV